MAERPWEWEQTPYLSSQGSGIHADMPRSKVRIAAWNRGSVGKGVHAQGYDASGEPWLWPYYLWDFLEKMGFLDCQMCGKMNRMSGSEQVLVTPDGPYATCSREEQVMSDQSTPAPVVYKEIPDFDGYRVGTDGSVWTCKVKGGNDRTAGKRGPWRLLKPFRAGEGYLAVHLSRNQKSVRVYIHYLVALAFIGPRPPGMDVCHQDNDRQNNVPSNLRYDTRSGNLADRDRHGTHQRGERNPSARLTNAEAEEIRLLRAAGQPLKVIAARFSVRESTVSRIANGKRRKEVKGGR